MLQNKCTQIDPNLFLIDLDQNLEGFRNFICAWVYRDESITFLVDPGPTSSINLLRMVLKNLGVERLDYILLTHVHIDHAGGTGALLNDFPDARVLCHPKGIQHMVTPADLWKGSLQVLGEIAETYGMIVPIPEERIFFLPALSHGKNRIEAMETPGHASHHLSYFFKQYLFAGEVAGIHQPCEAGLYLRPATPPKFSLETFLVSLKKVIGAKPETLCFGHYGITGEAQKVLSLAGEQLLLWTETVRKELADGEESLERRVIERLINEDKLFLHYRNLERDIQKREQYFIKNSISGIKDCIERSSLMRVEDDKRL
jgi:glyoxylase-like metal-dependent hydrolase (beta-lactamase superfamily II)